MLDVQIVDGIPVVHPKSLKNHLNEVELIDVRRPDEFTGELGHIEGSQLITLGPDLINFLEKTDREKKIVFVCRSGARSGQATFLSKNLGYKNTVNLTGGMILWNELKLPTKK